MRLRYLAPLAMAAAAAAIGLAPVAGAAPTGPSSQCTSTGNSTVCQRPGHVGIVNSPPVVSRPLYPSSHIRWAPCSSGTADSGSFLRSRSSAATSTASVVAVVE